MRRALGWLAALAVLTGCGYKSGFTLPDEKPHLLYAERLDVLAWLAVES